MTLRRPADLDALAWGGDGLLPVVVQEVASGAVLMLAWADREAVARTMERGEGWFWSRSRRGLWRKGETSGNTLAVAEVALDCDGDALLYRVDAAGPACHTGARSCFEEVLAGAGVAARVAEPAERLGERSGGGPGDGGEDGATSVRGPAGEAPRAGGDAGRETRAEGEGSDGAAISVGPRLELGWLWDVLAERAATDPADSYTARLLAAGVDRIARKVGEEATEVVIAALRAVTPGETADGPVQPPSAGAVDPAPASPLAAEAADLLYHLLVLLLAVGVPPEEVAAELRRRHRRPQPPTSPKPEDRS